MASSRSKISAKIILAASWVVGKARMKITVTNRMTQPAMRVTLFINFGAFWTAIV